jgi:hypothetical protein
MAEFNIHKSRVNQITDSGTNIQVPVPKPMPETSVHTQKPRDNISEERAGRSPLQGVRIKQAETVTELLSYIEKLEGMEFTSENYKSYLKPDFRNFIGSSRKLAPVFDFTTPSQMQTAFLNQMRVELFAQAAVLKCHFAHYPAIPAMTADPAAEIFVWLRQWCASAIGKLPLGYVPPKDADGDEVKAKPMNTLHDKERAVFINYAHADNDDTNPKNRWLDRFLEMVKPLVCQEELTHWSDRDIKTGDDWHARIQAQLQVAQAAVLLVSPAFLASDYIRNSELPVLLKNAADRGVKIFPVIIRPCHYERAKFKYPDAKTGPKELKLSSIQSANPPSNALSEMSEGDQDRLLLKVSTELHDLLSASAPRSDP